MSKSNENLGGGQTSKTGNRLIKLLLVVLVVPAIGLAVSYFIINDINEGTHVAGRCEVANLGVGAEITADNSDVCRQLANARLFVKIGILAILLGVLIPIMHRLSSLLAGLSKKRIAIIFPVVLRFSVLLVIIFVLFQVAILTYVTYIGVSHVMDGMDDFIVIGIGFVALIGGLKFMVTTIKFGGKFKINTLGRLLVADKAPQFFEFIQSLCKKLDTKVPDNIIVGLEPTFYVTGSDVQLSGHESVIKGETLFVSATLSRLFSSSELACVLGHELGHFRGEDAAYSMKFIPLYIGLGKALGVASTDERKGGGHKLMTLPIRVMLSVLYDAFTTNRAKISRDRESQADRVGAEAKSPLVLSTALVKMSLYSGFWKRVSDQNIERLNQGKIAENLSVVFQDTVKYDVDYERFDDVMQSALSHQIPHPTDIHSSISKRLEVLGVQLNNITKDKLLVADNPAIGLIDNYKGLEREITLLDHRLMTASDKAHPPEERKQSQLLQALYSLVASMIGNDGQINRSEVLEAERIGQKLFKDFDTVEFRACCHNLEPVSNIAELAKEMGSVMEAEEKESVMSYLKAVAESDGETVLQEQQLLADIASGLGVEVNQTKVS